MSGVLKEFAFSREDNKSNISVTQHRDLMGFLQQTCSSLGKCHLSANLVLNPLQLHPSSTHFINLYLFLILIGVSPKTLKTKEEEKKKKRLDQILKLKIKNSWKQDKDLLVKALSTFFQIFLAYKSHISLPRVGQLFCYKLLWDATSFEF